MADKIVIELDLEKGDVSGATDAIEAAGTKAGNKGVICSIPTTSNQSSLQIKKKFQ